MTEPILDLAMFDTKTLVLGIKVMASHIGVSPMHMARILRHSRVPGAFRIRRFGTPLWAIPVWDATQIREERKRTPQYDPQAVRLAFLRKYGRRQIKRNADKYWPEDSDELFNLDLLAGSPVSIVESGEATIEDWLDLMTEYRDASHMDTPVLMHSSDLNDWIREHLPHSRKKPRKSTKKETVDE